MTEKERTEGGLPASFFGLWIFLFVLWLIINSSMAAAVVVTGALISLAISWISTRGDSVWGQIAFNPQAGYHFIAYTFVFFIELVKANVNMLRYVYSPRIDIHPGIVKIHLRLRSPVGRLALANSIALTPGSLVMDIRKDFLFVHWLDVKTEDLDLATEMIAGPFEKHLGATFG